LRQSRRSSRAQTGAVAVEGALLFAFILAPLLLGVLQYGAYFWGQQRVPTLDPNVRQSQLVGSFDCGQLVNQLLQTVNTNLQNVDDALGLDVGVEDLTATVLQFVPNQLGVDVRVSISVPVADPLISFLPLPDNGRLVRDVFVRLENVKVTTESC
jgi:hypothetical protein